MGLFNFLGAVERQINPFDNGATAQNTRGNGQQLSTGQQIGQAGIGLGKAFISPFAYLAKTDIINPTRELAADFTGNKVASRNAIRQSNLDLGLGPQGTDIGSGLRKFTGNSVQAALTVLGGPVTNKIEEGVTGLFGFLAPNLVSRIAGSAAARTALGIGGDLIPKGVSTGLRLASGPVSGAALGAPFNVSSTVANTNQPLTSKALIESAKTGALTGAGLGLAGEAIPLAVKGAVKGGKAAISSTAKAAEEQASKVSGLKPHQVINDNEANTLRDYADTITSGKVGNLNQTTQQAYAISRNIGLNITGGSPIERVDRIYNYLSQLRNHQDIRNKVLQGGYVGPEDIKKLGETNTPQEASKLLQGKVPENKVQETAGATALTRDKNVISDIVNNANKSTRPFNTQQTAFEQAFARNDLPAAQQAVNTIPDPSLRSSLQGLIDHRSARGSTIPSSDRAAIVARARAEGQANPDLGVVAKTPQQTVLDAIQGSKGQPGVRALRTKQEALYTTERGQRFGAAQAAGANLEGTAGFRAELSKLGGKYTKVDWNGLQDQLGGPQQAEATYSQLRNQMRQLPDLTYTDKLNTDVALRKLVLGEGLPTKGDIQRLETAFGKDFAQSIDEHVSKFRQALDLGKQLVGVPRAIMSSGDVSFGGRQALAYATAHPIEFGKQWVKQFQYFKQGLGGGESQALNKSFAEIKSHPDFKLAQDAGLAITDVVDHNPATREEAYIAGNLAEKIPIVGRLVKGSDYAFTGLANNIRANSFYSLVDQARQAGYTVDKQFAADIAKVVNNGTGRGTVKALEEHMGTLSTALFSPRLMLSRLQTFNPLYYTKLNPVARQEAIRQLLGLGAFATSVLGMAKLAGLQVGTNPLSSDFGKIKIGDTRLDFMGGYTQYIRLGAQLVSGQTVSSLTGKASQLGKGYGSKSRKDIVVNFLENKENPVLSFITTLLQGKDAVGNNIYTPQGIGSQVGQRFVPLVAQDIADMLTHPGINPVIGGILATTGVGTQTYGTQDIKLSTSQQKYVDKLTAANYPKDQIQSVTDYYRVAHTGPDRTAASDQIKAALKAGDGQKAYNLAKAYNDAYAQTFSDWAKKYSQYTNDPTLLKDYQSNLITDNSLSRWYSDIVNNP